MRGRVVPFVGLGEQKGNKLRPGVGEQGGWTNWQRVDNLALNVDKMAEGGQFGREI